MYLFVVASIMALGIAQSAAAQTWPTDYVDPAAAAGSPADLVLPMPCGAGMAFQRIEIPGDGANPLDDRRLRLGQSLDLTGYADYLRQEYLRGSFFAESGGTHYFIARYELTTGQARALRGDCSEPSRPDRLAQGELSWFDAVDLSRAYSEWLLAEAPASLPRADDVPAFVRLPTEAEWEYAARGGARVDATVFPSLRYFVEGSLADHALHAAPGSSRGSLGPIGIRQPNPLGLYDVYGNAEELVLEPFRLNAVGRPHGQAGGVVTRGGSALSSEAEIYSAQRTEYPPFDPSTGRPLAGSTFGLRFVLSTHVATSDQRLSAIRDQWAVLAGADPDDNDDPLGVLGRLIDAEIDPRRAAELGVLQAALRTARERVEEAGRQTARATLLAGAVFVETIEENIAAIDSRRSSVRMILELRDSAGTGSPQYGMFDNQLTAQNRTIAELRRIQATYILSFRTALETLANDTGPDERRAAYSLLREELVLSNETTLLGMLDKFWRDLAVFELRPDLTPAEILALALD